MGQKHWIYFTLLGTTAWKHVRHVPQGLKWHKATDQLTGTDVYGDPKVITQPWSLDWSKLEYSEFLFSSGACKHWAVIRKEDLIGEDGDKWYSNADVDIQVSSVNSTPYKAKMSEGKDIQKIHGLASGTMELLEVLSMLHHIIILIIFIILIFFPQVEVNSDYVILCSTSYFILRYECIH